MENKILTLQLRSPPTLVASSDWQLITPEVMSTEYTVLTHIGVWVKTKINILYPQCKFNIYYIITAGFPPFIFIMRLVHRTILYSSMGWLLMKICEFVLNF